MNFDGLARFGARTRALFDINVLKARISGNHKGFGGGGFGGLFGTWSEVRGAALRKRSRYGKPEKGDRAENANAGRTQLGKARFHRRTRRKGISALN